MARVRDRILSGVTYTAVQTVGIQVISLCTFLITVRQISLEDFGFITLLFTLVSVATTFVGLGIEQLIVADVAVYRAKEAYGVIKKLFREYVVVVVAGLLILFAGAWVLRDFVGQFYDAHVAIFFWILAALICTQTAMNVQGVVFESHEKFSYLLVQNLSEAACRFFIIVSYFFWFGFSLQSVLYAHILAKLGAFIIGLPLAYLILQRNDVTMSRESVLWPILRRHGKWESSQALFDTVMNNVGPWIVNVFVSTEGVALYAFAWKINSALVRFLPVRSALFPILVHSIEKSKELACLIITKAKKYLFLVYLLFYCVIFIGAGPVIDTFAPQYHGADMLIRLTMLRLFIDTISLGQSPVFYALKQQKVVFTLALMSRPMLLLGQIIGTYYFGISGNIVGILSATFLFVVIREYILVRRFHFPMMNWKSLFIYDQYDTMLLNGLLRKFKLSK